MLGLRGLFALDDKDVFFLSSCANSYVGNHAGHSDDINKNAFQWDAYRPLGDRLPGGGGVCQGVSASGPGRGCLPHTPRTRGRHLPGQTDTCENIPFANFVCERLKIMLKTSKICIVVAKCERDLIFYNVELLCRGTRDSTSYVPSVTIVVTVGTLRLLYHFLLANAILIYAGRPAAQSVFVTFELFTVQGYN